jgi:two-component system cell cycle sensor histidine kinase PleC
MRALDPFAAKRGALIGSYSAKLAEGLAVRRAEIMARTARIEADLSIKARSEFLANMNHELRTPLNAIIGFATMLKESETYQLAEEQRRNYAEYILQSADLLLAHINTILETAALDTASVELAKDDSNLAEILSGSVVRATIAADAAGVRIENKTADEHVGCHADPERAGQAIDHLLRVALRASPKGGKLFVRASVGDSGWPEVAVRDKGPGLSKEAINEALSAFDQVHRGLDRSFAGPGVEYAVAKTFIEMQGGRFDIRSKLGEGVIVRIALPPPQAGAADETETQVRKAG